MNVVTRGIRNAFRNATRAISIIVILGLSIGLSVVMLIAHQAVENKIKTTLSSIGNTVSISPAGYSGLSQVNNALTSSQLKKVQKLPHVTSVLEMLSDSLETNGTTDQPTLPAGVQKAAIGGGSSGTTAKTSLKSITKLNCNSSGCSSGNGSSGAQFHISVVGGGAGPTIPSNFSLPLPIVGTNYPTDPSAIGANTLKVTSGKAMSGSSDTNDAMISDAMAKKNDLKVGSTFTAYGKTLTVAALFKSDTQSGNNTIVVSLPTEQRLSGQSGDVTSATATVDSLTNLNSTTSAIKKALGSSADVTSNVDQANEALQPLNSVKEVSLYSLIGAVAAGAVIILLVMVMIVRERRREIGVLKAIGGSNIRIMLQFMSEALTLTILAAVIGLGIGVVGGSPVTSTLVSNSNNSANSTLPGGMSAPGAGGGAVSIGNGGKMASLGNVNVGDITKVHAQIGYSVILYGLGAAVLIALIGSALASFFIAKVRPSEVLRSE